MIKKILVPVDGSEDTYKAIEMATFLATQNDAEIHLLYVIKRDFVPDGLEEYIRVEGIRETPSSIYYETMTNQILESAKQKVIEGDVSNVTTNFIDGDPATEIIRYANEYPFDLIIMGGYGMGSTVSKVCKETNCSCMITRISLLENKRVLIVDDEPDVLDSLEELLDMCVIEKASSFESAKKLLETHEYDLVILDIMGVEGYALLEIAKEKDLIVAMLTAHAFSMDDTLKSYKMGAASYIPKDKMANIATYLTDLLEAKQKGKHFWWRWAKRFGDYYEKKMGVKDFKK